MFDLLSGRQGTARLNYWMLWPVSLAIVFGLTACDSGGSGRGGVDIKRPPSVELSAWVGENNSELTVTGEFKEQAINLFTFSNPDCALSLHEKCSKQYPITTSPTVVDADSYLTLTQPAYTHLQSGDFQADNVLSAQRFSPRAEHQVAYFKGRFWLVGGASYGADDLWSSIDGRNWVPHTSAKKGSLSETGLFTSLEEHQLVVFDAAEEAGAEDLGEQLWVIGGNGTNQVWSSTNGIEWTLHTEGEHFTERDDHQVAVFDSDDDGQTELWMLGGYGVGSAEDSDETYLADVWKSTNGINWTKQTLTLGSASKEEKLFSARYDHQLVAFDAGDGQGAQLWLIGGEDDGGYLNDIWSSPDGVTWTGHGNAVDAADTSDDPKEAFTARYGHQVVAFDAEDGRGMQLWLVGGYGPEDYHNDVWSSSNGTQWTELQPSNPLAATFSAREGHQLLVADSNADGHNELWLVGGKDDSNYWNDAWSSRNGRDWLLQSPYADFSARTGHQVVVFDGGDGEQFWLVGGGDGHYSNAVWSSRDGIHWTQRPAVNSEEGADLFSPRTGHQLVVFNGAAVDGLGPQRLWLIGGYSSEYGRLNDLWSSSDGLVWTQRKAQGQSCGTGNQNNKQSECIFSGRSGHQVVVFDPTEIAPEGSVEEVAQVAQELLWLVGGYDNNSATKATNDIWSSPDGVTWTHHTEASNSEMDLNNNVPMPLFDARTGHQLVVFDGAKVKDKPELGPQRLWLIGGYRYSPSYTALNDIWSSADGIVWTKREDPDCEASANCLFSPRDGHQVVVFDPEEGEGELPVQQDKLWLIGGGNKNDIWSSENGIAWTKADKSGAFSGLYYHQAVAHSTDPNNPNKALWLIGGQLAYSPSNQVWRSTNGTDWRLSVKGTLSAN